MQLGSLYAKLTKSEDKTRIIPFFNVQCCAANEQVALDSRAAVGSRAVTQPEGSAGRSMPFHSSFAKQLSILNSSSRLVSGHALTPFGNDDGDISGLGLEVLMSGIVP
eukprot:gnl/TRDRNA2_/TRDRNA2_91110_c0_seq1.p1 gnl/TRDRNA2_/TRDRNA2_91110_c0~~gnl/TRDRNA2_/TRDRNA2_91110_c0_seq1.p1  ORF type:complete len:108 (+),score=12.91 gnl/TRDRNA2_/TRDRNA2_91110_c0_seq1:22-345(+)